MANKTTAKPDTTTNNNERLVGSATQNKVPFAVVEAYKTTRIHLISTLEKINGKVVAISSPNAAEGKSTTAINISIALSQLNKKVLVIDADSRRSTIHKKLKIENELGCLDIINGTAKFEDIIKKHNDYLDIITAGTQASNPSELFSTDSFGNWLNEIRDAYDYIIIDTPPINLVSDALVIAQKCDGLLLIVRADVTTYDALKRTINSTTELNINVLGVVINGTDSEKSYKYGKYGRYSKYGYSRYSYYRYRSNSYYGQSKSTKTENK